MESCTPISIESAEYCDNLEDEAAGLGQIASIFLHDDVETYPAYSSAADLNASPPITESMAKVRAAAALAMKTGKFPYKIPCLMEKNGLMIKDLGKGGWMNELTLVIQNTEHNRGVLYGLKGARFSIAVNQVDGDQILLGQSDGISTGYLARIQPQSIEEDFGVEFSDEKMIKFIIEAKPKKAVTYPFAIAYD